MGESSTAPSGRDFSGSMPGTLSPANFQQPSGLIISRQKRMKIIHRCLTSTKAATDFKAFPHNVFESVASLVAGAKAAKFDRIIMSHTVSAPLLSRVKSWQLVSLGLTGWC